MSTQHYSNEAPVLIEATSAGNAQKMNTKANTIAVERFKELNIYVPPLNG